MSVFADRQYRRNIKGGITLFSPMGNSLGDKILFTAIQQKYISDNPDETVILLEMPRDMDIDDCIEIYKPAKFFWAAEVTNFLPCPDNPYIIKYDLHREATALAEIGVYPKLWFEPEWFRDDLFIMNRLNYIIFHIRNITKFPQKNTVIEQIKQILLPLIKFIKENNLKLIILGNDKKIKDDAIEFYFNMNDRVLDFRGILSMPEITYLIKYCPLFIGSDSGIAHLAACCNIPMVSWNYSDKAWFPKTQRTDCRFFTKTTKFEEVLQAIKEKLNYE